MKNRRIPVPLSVLLMAALWVSSLACKASILIGPTATPWPTATLFPSETPYPTWTPFPTLTPRPTNTPLPTFTPSPTVTRTLIPRVAIDEDFEYGTSCFFTGPITIPGRGQLGSAQVKDGVYYLKTAVSADSMGWVPCVGRSYTDFTLEVDLVSVKPDSDERFMYGLFFREIENQGGYFFSVKIGSPGYYCLWYKDYNTNLGASLAGCTSPQPGGLDLCGAGSACRLKVKTSGDRIEMFVNGDLVAVTRDKSSDSGRVGLLVSTIDGAATAEIEYDNFRLTEP
jgi:hypothetical protein